jgi:predicted ATP-dependent serine protease
MLLTLHAETTDARALPLWRSATKLEVILDSIVDLNPRAVIVDSIQTVYLNDATGSAGSVTQVPVLPRLLLVVPALVRSSVSKSLANERKAQVVKE